MKIEYSSNNSGGSWWLTDENWRDLEKAGWHVEWGSQYYCGESASFLSRPTDKPDCGQGEKCSGHRRFNSADEMTDSDRWLGGLAKKASKDFESPGDAMREFESITGMDVMDEGCNCCGAPHSFSWDDGYASGEDCAEHLYGERPSSMRETLRQKYGR